jgi:hypothetical protein
MENGRINIKSVILPDGFSTLFITTIVFVYFAILLHYSMSGTYILWIHKFVIARVECGIRHKGTEHADKCSNNKTKTTQKQNDEIIDKYIFKML